jgi:hypothetical protein
MRHRWAEPSRELHRTERRCVRCGILRVTRHDGDFPWTEFFENGVLVEGTRTPPCEGLTKAPDQP